VSPASEALARIRERFADGKFTVRDLAEAMATPEHCARGAVSALVADGRLVSAGKVHRRCGAGGKLRLVSSYRWTGRTGVQCAREAAEVLCRRWI
jgi:hypothetical protein